MTSNSRRTQAEVEMHYFEKIVIVKCLQLLYVWAPPSDLQWYFFMLKIISSSGPPNFVACNWQIANCNLLVTP